MEHIARVSADTPAAGNAAVPSPYDQQPYVSLPITYTQPARLAAMAQVFGVAAPPAERACVLELGCASGGNLIPLAARHPQARFVGIDLAQRHVADARRRIAALGLRNIEIRQADLATADLEDGRFDYIIGHGVFSWTPPAVRDAILRICGERLSDRGVAAISYNVLPGFHLRRVVRDLCLQHAGDGSPAERVRRIRTLLDQMAAVSDSGDPYGLVLKTEAARLARKPAAYVAGEFLAEHNEPYHFRDFVAQAARHGLRYLCEGDVPASCVERVAPAAVRQIRAHAGKDALMAQALADAFSGRTFRRSILVRATAGKPSARPIPAALRGLHVSGQGSGEGDDPGKEGARIGQLLAERFPASCTVADLSNAARMAEPSVLAVLLRLVVNGRVAISSLPLRVGSQADDRPCVWPIARAEAAARQPWVTSLRHTPVLLPRRWQRALSMIDGTLDRRAIECRLGDLRDHRDPHVAGPQNALKALMKFMETQALLQPSREGSGE